MNMIKLKICGGASETFNPTVLGRDLVLLSINPCTSGSMGGVVDQVL